jgi:hypothetical protein
MTASRYKVPKNFALERFGINLLDLFEEDEEGTSYEFNGFEGLAPQFKTSNLEKGRGGALGYKTSPNAPKFSRTSEFSLVPEFRGGGGGGVAPTPVPPVEEEEELLEEEPFEERFLTSFIGDMGDPNKGVIGAMGVGRALEHGYTKEDVIKKAALEGIGFGEQAAKSLGLSDLSQYQGGESQSGTIGLTALSGARRAGLSDELIKNLAQQQGLNFGAGAASQLGVQQARPAATSGGGGGGSASNLSGFIGAAGNAGTLGLEAVNKARAQGISDAQIRQQAGAQGLGFGAAARAALGL